MDLTAATTQGPIDERDHLARAHHEICTALTVLRSNVELVRIHLRAAPLPASGIVVHAHLDALDDAVERLNDIAHEMKRWHNDGDGAWASPAPGPQPERALHSRV